MERPKDPHKDFVNDNTNESRFFCPQFKNWCICFACNKRVFSYERERRNLFYVFVCDDHSAARLAPVLLV